MNLVFEKYSDGLIPAIVQDSTTSCILMLGFMNARAVEASLSSGLVTFFSRSKQRLWRKGETTGNYLRIVSMESDCDADTILIKAKPNGPVCHTGADTCFAEINPSSLLFLNDLEAVIADRRSNPVEGSYTSKLFAEGINRIAQKVGEEAVETVIAAKDDDANILKDEAADLLFHYLVLLNAKGLKLVDIVRVLGQRHSGAFE